MPQFIFIFFTSIIFIAIPFETNAKAIKVGAILAVTGPASLLGDPQARTLEMLVKEINTNGGINGNKIDLIIKDSGANPEKAVSYAKELIQRENVIAIIGPSTSEETMKIKRIAEEGKTILISCGAAEVIVNPVARYVFKTPQKDSHAVEKIYGTMKDMDITKIAVLAGNTGFGNAGKGQLEKMAPEFGIEVLMAEVYDKKATDLSAVVAKLMANKDIQAVVNWSIVPAQGILAKNIRQAGWDVPLFQSHGFGNINYVEAGGLASEGIIFPAGRLLVADVLPDTNPQKELLLKYKNDYESRYKQTASTFGGHAYDALIILVNAIEKAGVVDSEKVRDALENLTSVVGIGGVFSFSAKDHNGLSADSFAMLTVKEREFAVLVD